LVGAIAKSWVAPCVTVVGEFTLADVVGRITWLLSMPDRHRPQSCPAAVRFLRDAASGKLKRSGARTTERNRPGRQPLPRGHASGTTDTMAARLTPTLSEAPTLVSADAALD